MGHVLERVKVLILRRHFYAAAPAIRPEKVSAIRIRDFGAVYFYGVIMEPFVQGPRVADPGTILAFHKRAAIPKTHPDALGLGRDDAEFYPPLRVHLRVLLALLVRR